MLVACASNLVHIYMYPLSSWAPILIMISEGHRLKVKYQDLDYDFS